MLFEDFTAYLNAFEKAVKDTVTEEDLCQHLATQMPQRLNKVHKVLKELYPNASASDLKQLNQQEQAANSDLQAFEEELERLREEVAEADQLLDADSEESDGGEDIEELIAVAEAAQTDKKVELDNLKRLEKEQRHAIKDEKKKLEKELKQLEKENQASLKLVH